MILLSISLAILRKKLKFSAKTLGLDSVLLFSLWIEFIFKTLSGD